MSTLISFIRPELVILVLIGLAFTLILSIVKRGVVAAIIGCMIVLLLLKPFISIVIGSLPWWINAVLVVAFVFTVISWIMGLVFGARTRSELAGLLLHDVILIPFRLIGFIARRR